MEKWPYSEQKILEELGIHELKKKKMNLDKDLTILRKLIQNGKRSNILRSKYLRKILNYKILEKTKYKRKSS